MQNMIVSSALAQQPAYMFDSCQAVMAEKPQFDGVIDRAMVCELIKLHMLHTHHVLIYIFLCRLMFWLMALSQLATLLCTLTTLPKPYAVSFPEQVSGNTSSQRSMPTSAHSTHSGL